MFTLTQTPVTFIGLLILFAFTTVWSIRDLTQPQSSRQRISNSLHLMMAAVMLAMVSRTVWHPVTAIVPLIAWVAIFILATAWYGYLVVHAVRTRRAGRPAALGHAISHLLMFAAMTWHLAGMVVMHSLMTSGGGHGDGGHGHGEHGMGEQMSPMMHASQPGGSVWWVAVIGLPLMVFLLGGAIVALVAAFAPAGATDATKVAVTVREPVPAGGGGLDPATSMLATNAPATDAPVEAPVAGACHEPRPVGSAVYRLGQLAHFAMLFGMFWMSTGLLTPILPFMGALAI